jgi:hypothetical protein
MGLLREMLFTGWFKPVIMPPLALMEAVMLVWLRCVVLLLLAGAWTSSALAQSAFTLSVPGRPELDSSATLDRDSLTIVDSAGTKFVYERAARFDSPDGKFLGFFSAVAGQAIRWPVDAAGNMVIGDAAGTAWRAGKQEIKPVVPAGAAPGLLGPGAVPGGAGVIGPGMIGTGSLAWLSTGRGTAWTAHINPKGQLLLFEGAADKWAHRAFEIGLPLVPGAPLVIVEDPGSPLPKFVTVDPGGKLIEILGGQTVRALAPALAFVAGSHLATLRTPVGDALLAIDARGRMLEVDLNRGRVSLVEAHDSAFPPGAPIAVVNERGFTAAYAVDRHGTLIEYPRGPAAWGPASGAATGFVPGSSITAAVLPVFGGAGITLAGVDWAGKLSIWKKTAAGWAPDAVTSTLLSPGAPVALGMAAGGPIASAVGVDGSWLVWTYTPAGVWTPVTISTGFISGAPVLFDAASMTLFTTDIHGHLIASHYAGTKWGTYFLVPGLNFTPQLLSRRVIPNEPLPPAQVSLQNSGADELVVQVVDQAVPGQPAEMKVAPGGAAPVTLQRDSGAVLEEVYLVPGPLGTLIEQTQRFPIPPQQRYTVTAWSNKVTYQYIDRRKEKPKGAVANFDLKSHVSLGVFPIPPGDLMADGSQIDVFREATLQRNPGAVLHYPRPAAPPIEFVPQN